MEVGKRDRIRLWEEVSQPSTDVSYAKTVLNLATTFSLNALSHMSFGILFSVYWAYLGSRMNQSFLSSLLGKALAERGKISDSFLLLFFESFGNRETTVLLKGKK